MGVVDTSGYLTLFLLTARTQIIWLKIFEADDFGHTFDVIYFIALVTNLVSQLSLTLKLLVAIMSVMIVLLVVRHTNFAWW